MMIKLNKKLYGASLIALAFSLNVADVNAQSCAPAPTCDTLGFTKSSSDCSGRSTLKCPFDTTKLFCADAASTSTPTTPAATTYKVGDTVYKDGTACGKVASVDSTGQHGTMVSQSTVPGTTKELVAQNCNSKSTCGADWGIAECSTLSKTNPGSEYVWISGGCLMGTGGSCSYWSSSSNTEKCTTGYCQASF